MFKKIRFNSGFFIYMFCYFDKIYYNYYAMSKKLVTIIVCLFTLIASAILLLVYFLVQDKKNNELEVSTIIVKIEDQTLMVGESKEDFYYINDTYNVTIQFEIENPELIRIENNNKIIALKDGKTKVKFIATKNSEKVEKEFNVTILKNTYRIEILPLEFCTYSNGVLTTEKEVFQFCITIYDSLNNQVDSGFKIEGEGFKYTLNPPNNQVSCKASKDCIMKVIDEKLGFEFSIQIISNY